MIELGLFDISQQTVIYGKGEKVYIPYKSYFFTQKLLHIYDIFNPKDFDDKVHVYEPFIDLVQLVYKTFNQELPQIDSVPIRDEEKFSFCEDDTNVVLAFSGGLDSCYQALCLKEKGYQVHLFHISGINYYEGNSACEVGRSFAQKMGMNFIEAKWKRNNSKSNPYRQYWGDNAIKNQLILGMMADYCIDMGWNRISLGEDNAFSIYRTDALLGINITDCREIQTTFEKDIHSFTRNLKIMLIDRPIGSCVENKMDRLLKLIDYNLLDDFYSCVGAARFNRYNHDTCLSKYGVVLPKHNCGCYCTKCAIHNLLLHYIGGKNYPENFISKCWERLWNSKFGNFDIMFGRDIPLEDRIKNLQTY
jgi:hypothetical protein